MVGVEVLFAPLISLRVLAPGACGHQGLGVSATDGFSLPVDEPATYRSGSEEIDKVGVDVVLFLQIYNRATTKSYSERIDRVYSRPLFCKSVADYLALRRSTRWAWSSSAILWYVIIL